PSSRPRQPRGRVMSAAMERSRRELARAGVPLVSRVARQMASCLWQRPPESDLACLGMLTLHDAALRHDPARSGFEAYLVGRLRWAMMSDGRLRARRAKLLSTGGRVGAGGTALRVRPRVVAEGAHELQRDDEPGE